MTSSTPPATSSSPRPTTRQLAAQHEVPRRSSRARRPSRAARCGSTTTPTTSGPACSRTSRRSTTSTIAVSTFNDTDEALTKLASGAVSYDIYFPSYDQMGTLVAADLLRPLTHDYIPNIDNLWDELQEPLVRPGLAVLRAVHRLHHRASAGAPTWSPRTSRSATTPTTCSGTTQYKRQHGDHRRLPHRDGDGAAAQRHHRHQHRHGGRPRRCCASRCSSSATRRTQGDHHDVQRASRPRSTACARCGPATPSTPRTTCPRTPRPTCCATGSPTTARGWSTTT